MTPSIDNTIQYSEGKYLVQIIVLSA